MKMATAIKTQSVTLELTVPLTSDKQLPATQGFFEALHQLALLSRRRVTKAPCYSAEIVATATGIRFLWVIDADQEHAFRRLLTAYYPEAVIQRTSATNWPINQLNWLFNFQLSDRFQLGLKADLNNDYDALSYLTAGLLKLEADEQIGYQLLLQPLLSPGLDIKRRTFDSRFQIGYKRVLRTLGRSANACLDLVAPLNATEATITKVQTHLFKVSLKVLISSPTRQRLQQHQASLLPAFSLFATTQQSLLASRLQRRAIHQFTQRRFSLTQKALCLNATELATLYHLPNSQTTSLEGMPRFLSRTLPPLPVTTSETDLVIGDNVHQDYLTPIKLSQSARQQHVYVLGGTGSGKTTLLQYQIVQDIRAGCGVGIIDPHGDLATTILAQIPPERQADVIYFNPTDFKQAIGINLLAVDPTLTGEALEHERDLKTEAMVSVLRKVFQVDEYEMGHRIEYILRNTIQTSFSVVEPNLFTIFKLLNNRSFNSKVVRTLTDPYLKAFWNEEIGRAGAMQKVKMQAGVTAKIGRFLFSASVKRAFNQPAEHCLDFQSICNQNKILICNFAKGLLGEDASRLFCATVLAQIQLTTLARATLTPAQRTPFYLYVDEFQNFATASFVEMLSEARKYGLHLVMAQQSMQQLASSQLIEIILANVGTLVVFRTSSLRDANLLLPSFAPLVELSDLINLPPHCFYYKNQAVGNQLPTSGRTKLLSDLD